MRKFKMAAVFQKTKIFWKLLGVPFLHALGVENFYEIALSRTVKDISNFVFLPKIQNGRHFSKDKKILKIGESMLLRCPRGRKFWRNRSILHRWGDISHFVIWHFSAKKMKNSKWPPKNFLGIVNSPVRYLENFAEIALSLTVKEIEVMLVKKNFYA